RKSRRYHHADAALHATEQCRAPNPDRVAVRSAHGMATPCLGRSDHDCHSRGDSGPPPGHGRYSASHRSVGTDAISRRRWIAIREFDAMTIPPRWRTFVSTVGHHLLVLEHSQVFDISAALYTALEHRDAATEAALEPLLAPGRRLNLDPAVAVSPQSISLNVSSSCNLACTYCYAGRGSFSGAQSGGMAWETARAAIDRLLVSCDREAPATIGFLGGEPFVNRSLIHRIVHYTAARGRALGQDVRFS